MAISRARRRAGLLQREVAEALGVSTGAVAMWDTGERKPRADTLVKLAALYGTTVDELLREADTGAGPQKPGTLFYLLRGEVRNTYGYFTDKHNNLSYQFPTRDCSAFVLASYNRPCIQVDSERASAGTPYIAVLQYNNNTDEATS